MGDLKGINHYFIRFLYLFIAWCVAIKPIFLSGSTTKSSFCSTLFLFFVPLVIDYWGMTVHSRTGRVLKNIGAYSTILPIVLIICISYDGLLIDVNKETICGISFYQAWWIMLLWVALSCIDWIYFSFSTAERKLSEQLTAEIRKEFQYSFPKSMDSRIKYHERKYESELAASSERGMER